MTSLTGAPNSANSAPATVDTDTRLDSAGPPDDAHARELLDAAYPAWSALVARLTGDELGLTLDWRYYRDGGWLCRALRGSKNLAWLAFKPGRLTVACYFAERHRAALAAIPGLGHVAETPLIGKTLPVPLELVDIEDVDLAVALVSAKRHSR
ncbi:DUF3788 family protein [Leucobacter aridicollis]|uniref:DUF3788 family protein n=1 Tax=Leucobacter aridicollis TaxID=283878 RepID=UPI002169581A|nr:DUF3788 family protein [Leucobacter aridicollis]MCS3428041.1 hypothetical protein [Leucobacter aridicollis]